MTADAVFNPHRLRFYLLVQLKHLFGANADAKATPLAPRLVYKDFELFCQKNTPRDQMTLPSSFFE
jgi:hypothetical protein